MARSSAAAPDVWDAARYARDARFVSDLGAPLLASLAPAPGEHILDLGCGDGALTRRIAEAGATVVGVDASPGMVAVARAAGLDARLGRGEGLGEAIGGDGGFDAVFSNAALHWMRPPEAVAAGVAAALRPGGRFVAEFGGHGNVAALRVALIAALAAEAGVTTDLSEIWFFPTARTYGALLEAQGFRVDEIELFPRPTPVAAGVEAWFATLAAPALALAPPERRAAVAARAAALSAPALRDDAGRWTVDYVRLRLRATLAAAS
ncbi:class I SAM-dependent methyltransferase [Rubrimonas cliftonensis]|uniref:class I SAM-dependent methyltransferase n=1 Tax=Rubrimonas cliftonensis TaxID=89524 RepID=UPI000B84F5B4|nr:class I SAM-dependent methyltransferase [Rubrimonas cliftonensis]